MHLSQKCASVPKMCFCPMFACFILCICPILYFRKCFCSSSSLRQDKFFHFCVKRLRDDVFESCGKQKQAAVEEKLKFYRKVFNAIFRENGLKSSSSEFISSVKSRKTTPRSVLEIVQNELIPLKENLGNLLLMYEEIS